MMASKKLARGPLWPDARVGPRESSKIREGNMRKVFLYLSNPMASLTATVTHEHVRRIDELVKGGMYGSRSEFIRFAIRLLLLIEDGKIELRMR